MWKSINSLGGGKKGVLPSMKSQDLSGLEVVVVGGGGLNLTCNSFTSAAHIVRKVRLKRLQHKDKTHDARS